jgi:putative SOS response-associated peptidase YedK
VQELSWGFPSRRGPVINVRDDNRPYPVAQRGLTPMTSFYESTDPADRKQKRKDWWEFTPTLAVPLMFAVAVTGEHYSLITTEPGPDIAPIKHRQPVVLIPDQWAPWLAGEGGLLTPSPEGMWTVGAKVFG